MNMKKFLSEYPELIKEWHPTKNGDSKPEDFTHGSGKKVWWLCPKNHSYESRILSRKDKSGCPYCSGLKVSDKNNLKVIFPKIASEWHPTKNGELTPDKVSHGSNKKVWWLCPKRHSFESVISDRTRKDKSRSCPFCSGQKVGEDNNLLFLFPKVACEWHPSKNGSSRPEDFTHGSGKKVWWLCPKRHEYHSVIKGRTRKKPSGCPHCYKDGWNSS